VPRSPPDGRYTHIYVYCLELGAEGAASEAREGRGSLIEFPPSKSSLLWRDVLRLRQQRLCTARIVCCRTGSVEAAPFKRLPRACKCSPPRHTFPTGGGCSI
jgi:hypothetical protein